MKKLVTLLMTFIVTCSIWAGNVITYTAEIRLPTTSVNINSGLHYRNFNTEIVSHTFTNGIGTITFEDDLTEIGQYAFEGCSMLTSITLPESVTYIARQAFKNCSLLTSINIPDSVTYIGEEAFSHCTSLTSITIPSNVTSIEENTFCKCTSLASITVPNSVTNIGQDAFYGCTSLTSAIIGDGVTKIDWGTFKQCSSLTSVYLGERVSTIATWAFYQCTSLENISFSNSLTWIGSEAFGKCSSLTTITIPNSVTRIGDYAFVDCPNLATVNFGNSVKWIELGAFRNCTSLDSIIIPNSVTRIDGEAFWGCSSLTSIVLSDSLTSINGNIFYGCSSLSSITIPNSVTSIKYHAFYGCSALTSITIPQSVTNIDGRAFDECSSLTSIYMEATVPPVIEDYDNYFYIPTVATILYIPCQTMTVYQNAWGTSYTFVEPEANYDIMVSTPADRGDILWHVENNCSNVVEFEAVPKYGYHFTQWSDGNTDNPRVLELTQDTSLIAEFAISLYNVSLSCNDSAMGSVSGAGVYDCFAPVTITATPKAHCHFVKWSDEVTTNPRDLELSQDTTFTAIFAKNQHVLTILSNDEIAGSVAGGGTFDYDSIVEISATANVGYKFVQWSDEVTTNPRQILIESDQTLTAQFEQCKYQLVLLTSDANAGYVYGGGEFTYSASTEIVALANEGYIFVDWSDGDTNASRTIFITEDLTLTANFSAIKYTITAEPNDPSMGQVFGTGEYGYNANVQLMAVANAGYDFVQWSNGETNNPYSFVANADLSIVAEFKESSSALEDITADNNATKVIVDGHVYIIRGNSIYNLAGSKVR